MDAVDSHIIIEIIIPSLSFLATNFLFFAMIAGITRTRLSQSFLIPVFWIF